MTVEASRSSFNTYKYATLKVASDSSEDEDETAEEQHHEAVEIIEKQPTSKTDDNGQAVALNLTDFASNSNNNHHYHQKQQQQNLWSKICNFFACNGQTSFWGEIFFPGYEFFEVKYLACLIACT